jgi:carbon storage regulator CsrA
VSRLVLERRDGESISIGEHVTVKVEIRGNHAVKLIIDAPPEIRVDRTEIRERPDFDPRR